MTRKRVICAGLITVDLLFDVPELPGRGEKHRARGSQMIAGGGALIAASAISALGGHAMLAGSVGDDLFGAFLREALRERGVDDTFVRTLPGVPTPRSAVFVTPDGDRTLVNARDARLFAPPDGPWPAFDAVLTDTRWPDAARSLAQVAISARRPCVVDAEAPLAEVVDVLRMASHVAFSAQGLRDLTGADGADALAVAAQELGGWVCVTQGEAPVLCQSGEGPSAVPVTPVEARNTLGAGDVWHGALALALAEGAMERDAVLRANGATASWLGNG